MYAIRGNSLFPMSDKSEGVKKTLEPGTYSVKYDERNGFFLEPVDNMSTPTRVYGEVVAQCDRIMKTFEDRSSSTGVLLSGPAGTGKTVLAKILSKKMREAGYSTILVSEPFKGSMFNEFVQHIEKAMFLFDEFEKVYNGRGYDDEDSIHGQNGLLTLLDGTYNSKKLFVMTANEVYKIDKHMLNRPGRLYYHFKYGALEESFIREYCESNLVDKGQTQSIVHMSSIYGNFSFDVLKAIIEEMNRYGLTASEASKVLNVDPKGDGGPLKNYEVVFTNDKGEKVHEAKLKTNNIFTCNQGFTVDGKALYVDGRNIIEVNKSDRTFTFKVHSEPNYRITLKQVFDEEDFIKNYLV